ncbi:MAG: hypothetical protein MUO85_06450, partial [candidate division Zixibacteria bacterium]|nr:hypothetical protein [candidate division Zixibacteria bacterium]
ENTALRWSLFSTLIPVATGVAIWILDKPESVPNYDPWGNVHYQDKEPNRAIPVTLILSGIFIGPSIGYFYAGESDRGLDGIGIRMVIALGTTALLGTILAKGTDTSGELGGLRIIGAWALAAVIGSGLTVGHSIYDIAKVKSTVRKHNDSLKQTTLILTPRYFVDSKTYGVGLQIKF